MTEQTTETSAPDGASRPGDRKSVPDHLKSDPRDPISEPDTFPREYVEQLRKEAAEARVKAKKADDYARALFHSRVAALGRLADPDDLPFDPDILDDLPALEAAVEDLIGRRPHLAARTPRGDIGQGTTTHTTDIDLAALLRGTL